jgi:hypothetical protein
MPSGRVADEVRDVLAGLLPNIRMLRDSLDVITAEFASRRGVWPPSANWRRAVSRETGKRFRARRAGGNANWLTGATTPAACICAKPRAAPGTS